MKNKTPDRDVIILSYIKGRHESVIEAVENNNIEPFKKFCYRYLRNTGSLPDQRDITFHIAARKIAVELKTIPAKTREKAQEWLDNIELEEDYNNGTAEVKGIPEQEREKE